MGKIRQSIRFVTTKETIDDLQGILENIKGIAGLNIDSEFFNIKDKTYADVVALTGMLTDDNGKSINDKDIAEIVALTQELYKKFTEVVSAATVLSYAIEDRLLTKLDLEQD